MEYLIIRINIDSVVAARFGMSGRNATLGGAAEFTLDGDTDLAAVAAQIADGVNDSPRVVLCLSPSLFAQRTVQLPLTDLRKVREVLSAHLQGEIALPVEEVVFDALPLAEGQFLALWAQRGEIAKMIDQFKAAGSEPQIVSSAIFAWPYLPGLTENCVVSDGAALAVITQGRLSYVRAFDDGDPVKSLSATLSALELSGDGLPAQMFVFGERAEGLAATDGLPLKADLLELPDELVTVFRTEGAFQQLVELYAVARACHSGDFPDFRRGELSWTAGNAKIRRQMLTMAVLTVVMILLLFVYKGLQYRNARTDLASLNSSIAAQYREIFPNRAKAVDEVAEVKGELRKLAGNESSSAVLDVLKKLAEAKGATINGLYEAEVEGRTVRVKGDARNSQAVNDFKSSLAGILSAIELGEIKSRPDGLVSFSLTGQIKEAK